MGAEDRPLDPVEPRRSAPAAAPLPRPGLTTFAAARIASRHRAAVFIHHLGHWFFALLLVPLTAVVFAKFRLVSLPALLALDWWILALASAAIAIALACIPAALAAARHTWTPARAAREADRALETKDTLAAAIELAQTHRDDERDFVAVTIRRAEELAASVNPSRIIQPRYAWTWTAAPLTLIALALTQHFLPERPDAARLQSQRAAIANEEARRELANLTQPAPAAQPSAADTKPEPTVEEKAATDAIRQIEAELASGQVDAHEARTKAAETLTQKSAELENKARAEQRDIDDARRSLARATRLSRENRKEQASPDSRSVRDALSRPDLEAAARALDELANSLDTASPEQREAAAREFDSIANTLEQQPEPTDADRQLLEAARNAARDLRKPPPPTSPDREQRDAQPSKPTPSPTGTDQQPPSQPQPQPQSQNQPQQPNQPTNPPTQPRQPDPAPNNTPPSQPPSESPARPNAQPNPQPNSQPNSQPNTQPNQPTQQQPPSPPQPQGPNPRPDQPPSQPPAPNQPQNQQPNNQPNQPTNQPQGQPQGQPQSQQQNQQQGQPQGQPQSQPQNQPQSQPQNTPQPGQSQSPSSTPQQGQPQSQPQNQQQQQQQQQPSGQPTNQPTNQPSPQPNQQQTSQPNPQPTTQPQPGAPRDPAAPQPSPNQQPGTPSQQPAPGANQPQPQPQSQPQPGDARRPGSNERNTTAPGSDSTRPDQPSSGPRRISEALRELDERSKDAAQQLESAKGMKDRAEELLRNASPEERAKLEELAKKLAQSQGPNQPRGSAPWRGPTQTFDARPRDPQTTDRLDPPTQRTIAEWLSAPKPGGTSTAGPISEPVRRAQESANDAIERQQIPPQYADLVKRVFRRYSDSAAKPAADNPPSAPAPGPQERR